MAGKKEHLGRVGVYNIDTGKISYLDVSPKQVVHFEFNRAGDEVWISGWQENSIFVYNDKTLKLKEKITNRPNEKWVFTPTGKFNVWNTSQDIY